MCHPSSNQKVQPCPLESGISSEAYGTSTKNKFLIVYYNHNIYIILFEFVYKVLI